ncbi:MAG: di-trans,poly-cis-decaprenylcistransferase [Rickettsiales bacterium]|nr:di-trans,poly-cis-decaprenylcistransferase [Rickettsiales bacterium]
MKDSGLKIPVHLAIIADGNGRWAKARGLPRTIGHTKAGTAFQRVVEASRKLGVKVLTIWIFSTENWDRPKEEVDHLMRLFHHNLVSNGKKLVENGIRLRILGDKSRFSPSIQKAQVELEEATKGFSEFTLNVAMNYGGRAEILKATREIARDLAAGKIREEDISEELFDAHTYTAGEPYPDLIVRTSGEQRLSGFMSWQNAYSELYFPQIHFPDLNEDHIRLAIEEYSRRERRYGKV